MIDMMLFSLKYRVLARDELALESFNVDMTIKEFTKRGIATGLASVTLSITNDYLSERRTKGHIAERTTNRTTLSHLWAFLETKVMKPNKRV
jgi:hypothetical protein